MHASCHLVLVLAQEIELGDDSGVHVEVFEDEPVDAGPQESLVSVEVGAGAVARRKRPTKVLLVEGQIQGDVVEGWLVLFVAAQDLATVLGF